MRRNLAKAALQNVESFLYPSVPAEVKDHEVQSGWQRSALQRQPVSASCNCLVRRKGELAHLLGRYPRPRPHPGQQSRSPNSHIRANQRPLADPSTCPIARVARVVDVPAFLQSGESGTGFKANFHCRPRPVAGLSNEIRSAQLAALPHHSMITRPLAPFPPAPLEPPEPPPPGQKPAPPTPPPIVG